MKLHLILRLKIKKGNRALEFDQSEWLKPYIELNTQKWIEAEQNGDKGGKSFSRLMNNPGYGKTM